MCAFGTQTCNLATTPSLKEPENLFSMNAKTISYLAAATIVLIQSSAGLQAADEKQPKFSASLGDTITLQFDDLTNLTAKAAANKKELKDVVLYLDYMPLKKLNPVAFCYAENKLRFNLERNPDNREQWRVALKAAKDKIMPVGAGLEDDPKTVQLAKNSPMQLVIFKGIWVTLAIVIIAAVVVLLVAYGACSNLLRDRTPLPESKFKLAAPYLLRWLPGLGTARATGADRPPFSLARVQMAVWFFLIAASYLFLWLVLGETNSFNSTALTLLGITIGTGLVARAIDVSKQGGVTQLKAEREQLDLRQRELAAKTAPTDAEKAELVQLKTRLAEIDSRIKDAVVPTDEYKSEGFLTDILSDENGVSLQRLQMVAWTLVLGLVFVAEVFKKQAMPEFDATLLGLMGISSGAFLGFKLPEKKTVPEQK